MSQAESVSGNVSRKVLAASATTVLLWASAFVVIRDAAPHFSPGALALGRLVVGTGALGLLLFVRGESLPPRAAWPGILIAGVLWFGGYMVALNWGEQLVDAGTASLVVNTGPILVALLGSWLLAERMPPRLPMGLAVSFGGTVLVASANPSLGSSSVGGILLCLLAAIAHAVGIVAQKPALRHASALQVTAFGCAVGATACLPFSGQLIHDITLAPWSATIEMVYLGLFPTAVAFFTWAYALSHTSAGKMGATTYVVPALVVGMAWILLDEVPATLALLGGALCLTGVAISRSAPRQRTRIQHLSSDNGPGELREHPRNKPVAKLANTSRKRS